MATGGEGERDNCCMASASSGVEIRLPEFISAACLKRFEPAPQKSNEWGVLIFNRTLFVTSAARGNLNPRARLPRRRSHFLSHRCLPPLQRAHAGGTKGHQELVMMLYLTTSGLRPEQNTIL